MTDNVDTGRRPEDLAMEGDYSLLYLVNDGSGTEWLGMQGSDEVTRLKDLSPEVADEIRAGIADATLNDGRGPW